ncbi:MAG: phenylalanine--tRNA ligase subunit beta [Acidobacteriota bacterium]
MRLLVSWLRDFVDVTASGEEIADGLGLRGFEVAAIEAFGDGDTVIDFEVTANRPDCLSVLGLAREVATLYDRPIRLPSIERGTLAPISTGSSERLTVAIADEELCPRYAAAVAEIEAGTSPSWLVTRLQAAGIRPISPVVDVTNYVLIEMGHPTHAFDLDRLAGPAIVVRGAQAGEAIRTLDGIDRPLSSGMLVIADRQRPQAVAGVMGGAAAEVSATTRTVAFESACFKPASVRRTSKRLGLKTEASSRFERGADISAPVIALQRIGALIEQIGAGRISAPIIDVYPRTRDLIRIHLRRQRLTALLGIAVPDREVERILRGLGFAVTTAAEGWDVTVPTFRVDVQREVDLVEEVGRHHGFDKLPATFPVVTASAPAPDSRIPRDRLVRRTLTAAGLSEAVTFGFIEAKAADVFALAGAGQPIALANPLSAKFETLRASLIPGLVDAVAHNRRHGREDVGLFEIGTRFSADGETRAAAVAWTGSTTPVHWSGVARPVDFFDLKGVVERLCAALGIPARFEPARESFLAADQAAAVLTPGGLRLGVIGQLAAAAADARELPKHDRVFVAELNLDAMQTVGAGGDDFVKALPRHPAVVRDLSIVVAAALPAGIIHGTIQAAGAEAPAPLVGVGFFDRYLGKGIPDGALSVSVRLTFQAPDRTLTDVEVQASVDAILARLIREHGAVQR